MLRFRVYGLKFRVFDRRTKEHILSLAGTLMKLMYLCLVSFFTLAVGFWLLALLYVMLNLFQHLTASLYLLPLLGEILKQVQDDV